MKVLVGLSDRTHSVGLLPADAQCVRTSQSAFLEIFCTAGSLATSLLTSSVAIAISLSASVWFFS
jgi:hypothetical protein